MGSAGNRPFEDPLFLIPRTASWLYSRWLVWMYPFASIGSNFSAQSSCVVRRASAPHIKIGDGVRFDRDVWLNVPPGPDRNGPALLLDDGCAVGRNCVLSAQNLIHVGRHTIFGPSVLLVDHGHEVEFAPAVDQCKKQGGSIRIEEGCWLGFRSAIVCTEGELVIGKNSVIGANSVVTRSIPPYSVVAGNPGKVVKHYEPSKGVWVLGSKGLG
jgi:acetyltransferase-like isoleucine patch superfamily enzyme